MFSALRISRQKAIEIEKECKFVEFVSEKLEAKAIAELIKTRI